MKGLLYSMLSLTGLLMLPGPLSAGAPSDSIPADERLNIRHDCTIYDSIIASWRETNMNDAFENFTQDTKPGCGVSSPPSACRTTRSSANIWSLTSPRTAH